VEKFLRPYFVLDPSLMAQGEILSWRLSFLCSDVVCLELDDYYFITGFLSAELHFRDFYVVK